MGNQLKWLLKEGSRCIFEYFSQSTPTTHTVSLAIDNIGSYGDIIYGWSHFTTEVFCDCLTLYIAPLIKLPAAAWEHICTEKTERKI